ncbi:MAG: hypothetical protein AAF479_12450 [Pseudomonadota bacterium]
MTYSRLQLNTVLASGVMLGLIGCSLPTENLDKNYNRVVRDLKLNPVYPPREEFQVGDVYFVSWKADDINDLDNLDRIYLGRLPILLDAANDYLASRYTYADTNLAAAGETPEAPAKQHQSDITNGAVGSAPLSRNSLPIVAFPAITANASSAGAFGGYGFAQSVGFAIGQNETVTLDFGDARMFGTPQGARMVSSVDLDRAFESNACRAMHGFFEPFAQSGDRSAPRNEYEELCGKGRTCDVSIVTRTYQTRKIGFNYSSSRIARAAAAQANLAPGVAGSVLNLPGNLDLSITVDEDTSPETVATLVNGLNQQINESRVTDVETQGINFVGFRGNSIRFERSFHKPVAFAYEAISWDALETYRDLCTAK